VIVDTSFEYDVIARQYPIVQAPVEQQKEFNTLIVPLLERIVPAQRDLVKASDNNILAEVKAILDQPTDDVRESAFKRQAKLWLESSAIKGISSWLYDTYSLHRDPHKRVDESAFRSVLRNRLLMPTIEGVPLPGGICDRCRKVWDQYHAFVCDSNLALKTFAHNNILKELAIFIRRVSGGSVEVQTEFLIPDPLPGKQPKRADIAIFDRDRGVMIYLDVTIACPTAIGRRNGPGGSAKKREYEKTYLYGRSYGPNVMEFFVPFAMECTGRYGEKAAAFIDKLAGISQILLVADEEKKALRRQLQRNISLIMARYVGLVSDQDRYHVNLFREAPDELELREMQALEEAQFEDTQEARPRVEMM